VDFISFFYLPVFIFYVSILVPSLFFIWPHIQTSYPYVLIFTKKHLPNLVQQVIYFLESNSFSFSSLHFVYVDLLHHFCFNLVVFIEKIVIIICS